MIGAGPHRVSIMHAHGKQQSYAGASAALIDFLDHLPRITWMRGIESEAG